MLILHGLHSGSRNKPLHVYYCVLVGLAYRGCWYLNGKDHRIGSFENSSPQLNGEPTERERPLSMCGYTAFSNGYNIFGLSFGGHCITGSSRIHDYQYQPSGLCRHGKGGYYEGWYIMDVYEITNQKSFKNSFAQISERESTQFINTGKSSVMNSGASQLFGSSKTHYTVTAILSLLWVGLKLTM